MGFAGTTILHPSNAPIVNRAFSPGPEQLAQYRAMIAEYERAQAAGLGSIMVGGEHIDKAHVETEIGRASCRERVCQYVLHSEVAVSFIKKHIPQHHMIRRPLIIQTKHPA